MSQMTNTLRRRARTEAAAKRASTADRKARLSSRAMLVSLSFNEFSIRRLDRRVTAETNQRHKASASAGRYNKCLVDPAAVSGINSTRSAVMAFHYQRTLPWLNDGARILSTEMFDDYRARLQKLLDAYDAEIATFIEAWPDHVAAARVHLGDMFESDEYPSQEQLRGRFRRRFRILPLPDARDFRVDLAGEQVDAIRDGIQADMHEAATLAVRDCFDRLSEVVGRMVERLNAYKPATEAEKASGTFRDSLVGNVRELVEILPLLNITGNARLAELVDRTRAELCQHEAQELRDDAEVRKAVRESAEQIMTDLGAFMGQE